MSELERLDALYEEQYGNSIPEEQEDEETPITSANGKSFEESEAERLDALYEQQFTPARGRELQGNPASQPAGAPTTSPSPQDPQEEISVFDQAKRKASIIGGGLLEGAAETAEFLPKTVAGAADEVGQWLGIIEPGQYPLQDRIDSIIRFDEIAEQIAPKKSRTPTTPFEYGLEAGARGAGSAFGFAGPLMAAGQKSLTPMAGQALSTGQRATIQQGGTLRTPSDVLRIKGTPTAPMTPATLAEKAAAAPRATAATEGAIAAGGGLGAGFGASGATTPEGMEEGARAGEIAGTLAFAMSPLALSAAKTVAHRGPTGMAVKWLWKKSQPTRELMHDVFNRDSYKELSFWQKANPKQWRSFLNEKAIERYGRRDVLRHLNDLVPTKDIENKIANRVEVIRRLQKIAPEFNPSLGAIIGTPEAKAFQQVVDFQNPDLALEMYHRNQAAMKKIRDTLAKDPTYKYSDELGDLLEMVSNDTRLTLDSLQQKIDNNASALLAQAVEGAGMPSEQAAALRQHMENMKAVYDKVKNDLYAQIEVPKGVKFKVDSVEAFVKEINNPTNPNTVEGSGIGTLTRSLPAAFREAAAEVTDKSGNRTGPITLPYDTLSRFVTRLGEDIADIRSTNPNSPHLRTLSQVRDGLNEVIDQGIDSLPEQYNYVKTARDNAREFFRDEYIPRFRTGTLMDLQKVNPDGTLQIADDAVMSKFWQQGDKTKGAQEFKQLFERFSTETREDFDPDALATLAEEARNARASLERYAFHTLDVDLRNAASAKTNPQRVLDAWRKKYRGALEEFPDIAKRTEKIDEVFSEIAEQHQQYAAQRDYLSRNVINKYFQVDPDKVIDQFMSSGRNASRILDQIESIYQANPSKIKEIKDAMEIATINKILRESVDPATGKFRYREVARTLDRGRDSLPRIMGQDNYHDLLSFNNGLAILEDQPGLIAKAELNELSEFLKKAGVSPASILSRYYSASLGKVGPLYLATDAATRFINKRAEVYFQTLYKELMYDPDTLKNLENLLKDAEFMSQRVKSGPATAAPRMALILSTLGINLKEDMYDGESAPDELYQFPEETTEPTRDIEEVEVPPTSDQVIEGEPTPQSTRELLDIEVPEGTGDGVYEDASGNQVEVRGGKVYGL